MHSMHNQIVIRQILTDFHLSPHSNLFNYAAHAEFVKNILFRAWKFIKICQPPKRNVITALFHIYAVQIKQIFKKLSYFLFVPSIPVTE